MRNQLDQHFAFGDCHLGYEDCRSCDTHVLEQRGQIIVSLPVTRLAIAVSTPFFDIDIEYFLCKANLILRSIRKKIHGYLFVQKQ